MKPALRVEPWVVKLLTAALVVIALVAIVVLLFVGLGRLADLVETIEGTRLMASFVAAAGTVASIGSSPIHGPPGGEPQENVPLFSIATR